MYYVSSLLTLYCMSTKFIEIIFGISIKLEKANVSFSLFFWYRVSASKIQHRVCYCEKKQVQCPPLVADLH